MKKLILLLIATLLCLAAFSQQTYVATSSEVYEYKNQEWKLLSRYNEVTIPLHVMTRFIHVEAKQNGYFLLSRDQPVVIDEKLFKGFRYEAYDLNIEKKCVIDIVDSKKPPIVSIVSISYLEDGVNIRYFFTNN